MSKFKISDLIILLICIIIPLAAGSVSGIASATGVNDWYLGISKPSFNPPGWIFGPVWTLLYILMGISLFLVWKGSSGPMRTRAVLVFSGQLILNFLWSFLFFYFHWLLISLIEILMIWFFILWMILLFRKISKTAAYLQIPYLLWVSFATVLTAAIYFLNR